MGAFNLPMPNIDGDSDVQTQLRQIRSYLANLNNQLRYNFANVDEDNFLGGAIPVNGEFERVVQGLIDDYSTIQQTANKIRLAVAGGQIYQAASEAALLVALAAAGVPLAVGTLWNDTTAQTTKRCTSVGPPAVWQLVHNGIQQSGLEILNGIFRVFSTGSVDIDTPTLSIRNGADPLLDLDSTDGLVVGAGKVTAASFIGNVVNTFAGGTFSGTSSPNDIFMSRIPKYLRAATVVNLSGTYNGDITIPGFLAKELRVNLAADTVINGNVRVENCSFVNFNGVAGAKIIGSTSAAADTAALAVANVGKFTMDNVKVIGKVRTTASDGSNKAFYAEYSVIFLYKCDFQRAKNGVECGYGVTGQIQSCTGGKSGSNDPTTIALLNYGVLSEQGAHVAVSGTIPEGFLADQYESGGSILGTGTGTESPDAGSAPPSGASVVRSYTQAVYGRIASLGGTEYRPFVTTNLPAQGIYSGYNYFGIWTLDCSAITDRTNATAAALTVTRRATGGSSGAIDIKLHYTTTAWASISGNSYSATTARALFTDSGLSASLARGASAIIPITGATLNAIKDGTIKGFGVVDSVGGFSGYLPLEADITLDVTTPS